MLKRIIFNSLKSARNGHQPWRGLLSQPIRESKEIVSISQARHHLKEHVGSSKSWDQRRESAVYELALAEGQAELPAKSMADSFREACIPLGRDEILRGMYINFHNTVRIGRIMEDLDTMAVWIGYTHNAMPGQQKSPLSIVTAMVDRIDMKSDVLVHNADVILSGHVTWVGSTSMEVSMQVEQELEGQRVKCLDAQFLMVARDPRNKGKAFVNPLTVSTAEEKAVYGEGEKNRLARQLEKKQSLLKTPPSEDERLVVHDLFLKTLDLKAHTFKQRVKPEGSVWMENAKLKNCIICFPEQRNLYNKIFGGFLMRSAFELGWANATMYSKGRIYAVAVDDIMFQKPVEIGDMLFFSSQVVFTDGPHIQVQVHTEVVDQETGVSETTNIFHFTFTTGGPPAPTVIPKTYAEYMMYLDGARHFGARHGGNGGTGAHE